ncbi:MAG: ester cyclase [Nitrososphaerota archaeon]|nr:ester cyclase [Nitrososphaerota archaeon]
MPVEENKALVRHWFGEIIGKSDPTTVAAEADKTFAPEFLDHDGPDPEHGREAMKKSIPVLMTALSNIKFTIEQLFGEGNLVAVRFRGEATHSGEIKGIPATGKKISWNENEIFRFKNGRIVESWGEGNAEEALSQVGLSFKGRK